MMDSHISVVIPAWNGRAHLPACLEALLASGPADLEVVVVDNASTDGSADLVAERYPQVQLIRNPRNLGFSGGCNAGLRAARGDPLVLLNQDVIVRPGWPAAFAAAFANGRVGIVGAKLLGPDGRTLMHAGAGLEWPLALGRHVGVGEVDEGQYDQPAEADYVTGAFLAVRRAALDEIGLLDERFYPAFYEDIDLCWRARRAGWQVRYEPQAAALHDEASSTRHHWLSRHYYHYRNRLLFVLKHFSPAQILEQFLPAERARIPTLPPEERRAGHVALAEVLALWPAMAREISAADAERLADALRALREQIVCLQGGDPALVAPRPASGPLAAPDGALAAELLGLWEIAEPAFTSRLPMVGRWVAAFRSAWNAVATKWYVRPMLSQQVQFNGAVVRALLQLHDHYWDSDALLALLAERCGRADARIAELEERLARIEAQEGRHGR